MQNINTKTMKKKMNKSEYPMDTVDNKNILKPNSDYLSRFKARDKVAIISLEDIKKGKICDEYGLGYQDCQTSSDILGEDHILDDRYIYLRSYYVEGMKTQDPGMYKYPWKHYSPLVANVNSSYYKTKVDNNTVVYTQKESKIQNLLFKLVDTYNKCTNTNDHGNYHIPRRVLTTPDDPMYNNGFDNINHDYIFYSHDIIGQRSSNNYQIMDLLGHGVYGQVLKAYELKKHRHVAIKVIKSQLCYHERALDEYIILKYINDNISNEEKKYVLVVYDQFKFRSHLCIVMEPMSINLYQLMRQSHRHGFPHKLIRIILKQICHTLSILERLQVIHGDLKLENILLRELYTTNVKVADYGSAIYSKDEVIGDLYQPSFYRAPEIILGHKATCKIDMWSLGCLIAELFLGFPLFPSHKNFELNLRHTGVISMPESQMLANSQLADAYYNIMGKSIKLRDYSEYLEIYKRIGDQSNYQFFVTSNLNNNIDYNSYKEYLRQVPDPHLYFSSHHSFLNTKRSENDGLLDIDGIISGTVDGTFYQNFYKKSFGCVPLKYMIMYHPLYGINTKDELYQESIDRALFLNLLEGILQYDPVKRITPSDVLSHPYLSG